jgi:hypothetical protein
LAVTALADPDMGLFSPARLDIGEPMFDSEIEAAVLGVDGVVAILPGAGAIGAIAFTSNGSASTGPLHSPGPGQGSYYALDPSDIIIASPHGG